MADRIFPNRFQEDPLDSDLVFQGIDWDNFNQRLAEAKDEKKKVPVELMKALHDAHEDEFDGIAKHNSDDSDEDAEASMDHKAGWSKEAKKGLPEGLKKWMEENGKGKKKSKNSDDDEEDSDKCPDCDCDPCECEDEKGPMKRKGPKSKADKKAYHFTNASQLSAEAVEAAVAAGNEDLKNAILAARHERRVRLAGKIERQVRAQQETNLKLAQRRAYREALVQKVAAKMDDMEEKETTAERVCESCGKKYAGMECKACGYASSGKQMKEAKAFSSAARRAFAAKAIAEGFPVEYVNARLGETSAPAVDKLADIKNVLASGLETNVKVAAASSMIKVATLSDADYSRIIDYWKNELGYGDQEWIDALFTKKYDK